MKLYYLLAFLTIINLSVKAQKIEINVSFNNPADEIKNSGITNKIKSGVNISDLQNSLNNDYNITKKELNIQAIFYDRGHIGQLKLRSENKMLPEGYITAWKEKNKASNNIAFLYVKQYNSETYSFYKLFVSETLEENHLFPIVVDYINSNLKGDIVKIILDGTKFISKAINPVWNESKKNDAVNLIANTPKYLANRINASFDFSHLDFMPTSLETIDKTKYKMVACEDETDRVVSNKYIYTDPAICKKLIPNFYSSEIQIGEEAADYIYFKSSSLSNIIEEIEYSKKHHPDKYASDYNWIYDKNKKPPRAIKDFIGFRDRKETDRLLMYVNNTDYLSKNGEEISILSDAYGKTTWCNVFAMDLSNQILFGHIPWQSNMCANYLHYTLSNDKANYRELTMKEAWEYTMAGYVVYLTSFHYSMSKDLLNRSSVSDIPVKPSGHIAICYPQMGGSEMENILIQAGGSCGKLERKNCFGSSYKNIKAHIYLGYIIH